MSTEEVCSIQFCVRYRRLNATTVRNAYPIPRMYECINFFSTANVSSTLECRSGYTPMLIKESDRHKTTFSSYHRLYKFACMSFALRNTTELFQRAIGILISCVLFKFVMVYLDYITVFSNNAVENLHNLESSPYSQTPY